LKVAGPTEGRIVLFQLAYLTVHRSGGGAAVSRIHPKKPAWEERKRWRIEALNANIRYSKWPRRAWMEGKKKR